MSPEILKMQQDLERFRASKMGGPTPSLPEQAPVATSTPASSPVVSSIDRDLQNYRSQKQSGTLPKRKQEEGQGLGSKLADRFEQGASGLMKNLNPKGIVTGRAFLRPVGAAGGAVGDIIGAGIEALPGNIEEVVAEAVQPVVKPVMDKVAPIYADFKEAQPELAQDVEDLANATNLLGVGALKKPVTTVVKKATPDIGPSVEKHFVEKNKQDIIRPTTVNEAKYAPATDVYNNAKARGINLEEVAADRGIRHDQYASGGRYNTDDVVENIRNASYKDSERFARPAIRLMQPGIPLAPVSEFREALKKALAEMPDSRVTVNDREWMSNQIEKMYSDNGPAARHYPNGYTLENLHDNRIASQKNGKYKRDGSALENRPARLSRLEGEVFAKLFDERIPDGVPLKAFRNELEKNFLLANYLESLHNKAVPEGITKRATRLFGRAVAATVGGKLAGFPGSILGAQYGDILFSTFETLPNPVKNSILKRVKIESPEAYKELIKYIETKRKEPETILKLPAPPKVPVPTQGPRLFATEKGTLTPSRQEAADMAAVESGAAKRPFTEDPRWQEKVVEAQENLGAYLTPSQMKTIMMGKKVKLKVDGKTIDIDADDLPKVFGPDLKNPPEAYIPEDQLPVIDFGSKPKKPKKSLNDIYID